MVMVKKLRLDFPKLDGMIEEKAILQWYNKVEFLCKMWFGKNWEMYYRAVPKHRKYIPLSNNAILKIEKHCWIQRVDYLFDEEKHKQEAQRDNHSAFSSQ